MSVTMQTDVCTNIQDAIDRGFVRFDTLRGKEPYSYCYRATDRPLSPLLASTVCSVPGSSS
jgi:hypothetical protein